MNRELKYDWNDICIVPTELSDISSRSQINPYMNEKLPLFVAPMDTVVNKNNAKLFLDLGFNVCLPRGIKYTEDLHECFFSYGLDDIEQMIKNNDYFPPRILIDIANGHMKKLYDISKYIKENYTVELMVGNIANPKTFVKYQEIGVDWVRVGIGAGQACTTSANGGVHYPMASLVRECYELSNGTTKIIADGGFKNYSDIIKSIGLGSHSVMLGSILNKCLESCSSNYKQTLSGDYVEIDDNTAYGMVAIGNVVYKKYRGMSTKEVQKDWGRKELRTSEGIIRYQKVEYNIKGWVENFIDYLKSNMSYCGKSNLLDYIGKVEYIFITNEAFNRYNK
jgi:IMP dehydrogenase/GMP reductase